MPRVREFRFFTALAIILVAAFLVLRGMPILRFAASDVARQDLGIDQAAMQTLGLAALARHAALEAARDESGEAAQSEQTELLSAILERQPIASAAWLSLSKLRALSASPTQDVVAALALSNLTGPNEGDLMAGRAVMGFAIWDRLPPDIRRTTINDLVGGFDAANATQRDQLRTLAGNASDKDFVGMRAQLLLAGAKGTKIAKVLGFEDRPPQAGASAGGGAGATMQGGSDKDSAGLAGAGTGAAGSRIGAEAK